MFIYLFISLFYSIIWTSADGPTTLFTLFQLILLLLISQRTSALLFYTYLLSIGDLSLYSLIRYSTIYEFIICLLSLCYPVIILISYQKNSPFPEVKFFVVIMIITEVTA